MSLIQCQTNIIIFFINIRLMPTSAGSHGSLGGEARCRLCRGRPLPGCVQTKSFFHDQDKTMNWLSAMTICYYLLVLQTAAKSKQSKTSQNYSPDDIQNMTWDDQQKSRLALDRRPHRGGPALLPRSPLPPRLLWIETTCSSLCKVVTVNRMMIIITMDMIILILGTGLTSPLSWPPLAFPCPTPPSISFSSQVSWRFSYGGFSDNGDVAVDEADRRIQYPINV